ncbi:hypothetical protein PV04_00904 [Phialophora macrospora]|uniref:Uncharacterized protein n=1 Tax=Phialophora macrospora TaxID=1851006 RepID=A0A0D2FW82_9EURO|nr:hypothetical protein PV04_00904 [Phialophora macrospora]
MFVMMAPRRAMAYISFARDLSDTIFFLPTPDQGSVETIELKGGRLDFRRRCLDRFPGANARVLLFAFCHDVAAPYEMSPGNFRHACGIAQQLLRASNGSGAFARDCLPVGIQGVKELNWTKQNDQFVPLREEHHSKQKEPEHENQSEPSTDPKGNKYTFHGWFDEDLVLVDETLKEAGLLKLLCHTFDVPGVSEVKWSWQVFAKLDQPEFAAFCPGKTQAEFQEYGALVLAGLKLFSEARSFHEQASRRGEELMLRQEIKRGEFLAKTTVVSETAAGAVAVAESSHCSEQNLPATRDSDASAAPGARKQREKTHSQSSSQVSSSSPSPSDAMEAPRTEGTTASNQETSSKKPKKPKKKKKKPKKQAPTQPRAPSEGGESSPTELEPSALVDDMPKSIASDNPINPSVPDVSPYEQHRTQANDGVPTSSSQDVSQLAGKLPEMRLPLPLRPAMPLPPKPPTRAKSQTEPNKDARYLQSNDSYGNEDRMASNSVSNKSTSPITPSITSPMPTHPGTQQHIQEKNARTDAAASTPETSSQNSDIVGISKPGDNTKSASGDATNLRSSANSQATPCSPNDAQAVESPIGDLKDKQPGKSHGVHQETAKAQAKGSEEDCKDGSSTKKEILTNPQTRSLGQHATSNPAPTPTEFKFDSFHPRLKCPKPDCRALTSCWDRNVVICPACGTDSFTRYCKKQHLYDDIQRHWTLECRQTRIAAPIDRDTIRPYQIPKRPYIMGQMPNLVERHRQAVYRAMDDADYYIFADLDEIEPSIAEPTPKQWNAVRGTGRVVLQIKLADDGSLGCESRLFAYHIQRILAVGKPVAPDSCNRALGMIRNALIRSGTWTEEILTYLCMQLPGEWGGFQVPQSFWNVAEVNAVWSTHGMLPVI